MGTRPQLRPWFRAHRTTSSRPRRQVAALLNGSASTLLVAPVLPATLPSASSGLISGTGRTPGTSTVTVTGTAAAGVPTTTTFIWTIR